MRGAVAVEGLRVEHVLTRCVRARRDNGRQPGRGAVEIESTREQGWFQLALRVPDIEATFAAVVAVVLDPDGNLVEFVQRPSGHI